MSDMQTALTKALEEGKRKFMASTLNAWEAHEQTIRQPQQTTPEKAVQESFNPTGNMSQDVFNYIRIVGPMTRGQAADVMTRNYGYSKVSVTSIMTQMVRVKLLRQSGNLLSAATDTYIPIGKAYKSSKPAAKPKAPKAPTAPTSHGIAALKVDATEPVRTTWDADTVIANIGIKEAYKLYEELTKYFGRRD